MGCTTFPLTLCFVGKCNLTLLTGLLIHLLTLLSPSVTLLPLLPHRACKQAENNSLAEALARHKAEVTVLTQKRARVEHALEQQVKEGKALKLAAQRLQVGVGVGGVCEQSLCWLSALFFERLMR